jgi:hypothetical protein
MRRFRGRGTLFLVLLSGPAPPSAATFGLWLLVLLTARQVDNLGAKLGGDGLQLRPSDTGPEYFQVWALNGDDGEAGAACAPPGMASFPNKDLGHT